MKIVWKGPIFYPTGISTAARELVYALEQRGHKIQCTDVWSSKYEFNEGLDKLNKPIDVNSGDIVTVHYDYPQRWSEGYGQQIGAFVHEGTRLFPEWVKIMNNFKKIIVPSQATRNLFKWNNVQSKIYVIPHGVLPIYSPAKEYINSDDNPKEDKSEMSGNGLQKEENQHEGISDLQEKPFIFLSVNSWTGEVGDRKGTDLLIKAFDEEFKNEPNVKLLLKISTFWDQKGINFYMKAINKILGDNNPNILVNEEYVPEKELVTYYQKSDCFVAPTRGEGFGMTILNAMACGMPVVVTKDNNSGHMDFCRGKSSVVWIDSRGVIQGDRRFYCEGNMLADIKIEDVRKAMRVAYETKDILKKEALNNSKEIRENWSWDKAAIKFEEAITDGTSGTL